MNEQGMESLPSYEFLFVNDPNTGAHDAILELWDLGEHNQATAKAIERITELNGGVFGPLPKRDADKIGITSQALIAKVVLIPALGKTPEETQFVAVGEKRSYALRVSYGQPYETQPSDHPGIHAALGKLVGDKYITITRKPLGSKK